MPRHLVEQAAIFLKNNSAATPKQKLAIGGKLLWSATVVSKGWTPELLDQARATCKFLLKQGNIKRTLDQMDEKDASRHIKQFTKDVTQLAADIEEARNQQPIARKS
jgi:hypothetical protein